MNQEDVYVMAKRMRKKLHESVGCQVNAFIRCFETGKTLQQEANRLPLSEVPINMSK